MIYFNSRHLSVCLEIKLAKWKRWTREFLPPDPLSGMQSGYARNLNLKDAFHVYLAGYLVSAMRFGIAQVKQIMIDIEPLLKEQGFQALQTTQKPDPRKSSTLLIYPLQTDDFGYIEVLHPGEPLQPTGDRSERRWRACGKQPISELLSTHNFLGARLICLSAVYGQFIHKMDSYQDIVSSTDIVS